MRGPATFQSDSNMADDDRGEVREMLIYPY